MSLIFHKKMAKKKAALNLLGAFCCWGKDQKRTQIGSFFMQRIREK